LVGGPERKEVCEVRGSARIARDESMSQYIIIRDDGSIVAFNPADWVWMPTKEDVESGRYDMKFECVGVGKDSAKYKVAQEYPPLAYLGKRR
jgi:hypothetical protein